MPATIHNHRAIISAMRPGRGHAFFQLEDARDLIAKLESDDYRLRDNPIDSFAAFDFFVTVTHIPEWLKPLGLEWQRPAEGTQERAITDVCGHLGHGAKHFVLERRLPKGTEATSAPFVDEAFSSAFADDGNLIIHLNDTEAAILGRPTVSAIELAGLALSYWQDYPPLIEFSVRECAQTDGESLS